MALRWKVIVGIVVAALLLLGTLGGVALAQSPTPTATPTPPPGQQQKKALLDEMARILGVDPQKAGDAFDQAQKTVSRQRQDAAVQQRLGQAVQNGKLTQAQADEIAKWWKSRPDTIGNLGGMLGGSRGFQKPMPKHKNGKGFRGPGL